MSQGNGTLIRGQVQFAVRNGSQYMYHQPIMCGLTEQYKYSPLRNNSVTAYFRVCNFESAVGYTSELKYHGTVQYTLYLVQNRSTLVVKVSKRNYATLLNIYVTY